MIHFRNVVLRYDTGPEILSNITFTINTGEFRYVLGSSEAGKTSLLRLMYLAQSPSQGSINLFGTNVGLLRREELAVFRRNIGIVFQDYRLLPHLTASDNIALPLRIAGVSESTINKNVLELMEWVGLENQFNQFPASLSSGQKQRVALARAVVTRPKLLVADEPTGNLDKHSEQRLMYLFEELNKTGTTVVLATHNKSIVTNNLHPYLKLTSGKILLDNSCLDDT